MAQIDPKINPTSEYLQHFPASGQLLRSLIEDIPAPIALFDQQMCYLASSKRWRKSFDLEGEALPGRSYYELFPDIGAAWKEVHEKCLQGELMRGEEDPFVQRKGKLDWVKWEIRPWLNAKEAVEGLLIMMEVVSEQRSLRGEIERSRNELLDANAYLQSVLAAAREVGIIVTNEKGIIRLFNSGAQKMLGYTSQEVEDKYRPSDFRDPKELHEHSEALTARFPGSALQARIRKLEADGVERGEWTLVRKDGSTLIASVTISPLKDAFGEIIGSVGFFQDITREKEAQRKLYEINDQLEQKVAERTEGLIHANEEIKNFAYIVSHDLRVPLVNIKGFSGELETAIEELGLFCNQYVNQLPEKDQQQIRFLLEEDIPESLHFINNSATRMDAMLNAVLKLSRFGRRKLEIEPIHTRELIEEILTNNRHLIEEKQINITVGELPDVKADKVSVEQMFSNLIHNAIKYLQPGRKGEIEIWGQREKSQDIFFVRDNGVGIAGKDLPRIFNIFYRAGKQSVKGEGMGLSYVRTLVRKHGGEISCNSTLNEGCSFRFSLSHFPPDQA